MERIEVQDCYKCKPEIKRNLSDFVDGGKYKCQCGHIFSVQDPSKVVYMDSNDFPKPNR